jgi:ADP-heptose:LPS heptosyltransferase
MVLHTAEIPEVGTVFPERLRIYCGLLGQIGDIIGFTATVRRIRQLYPNSEITFAVSAKYREAGELVAGLPYVDRLFVTRFYFENLTPRRFQPWERGWPLDLRGDDEVAEQRRHDIVMETRPRHRRKPWWEHAHAVEELADMVGVPGPIERRTEIKIPEGTVVPEESRDKIVLHNDPTTDPRKAWPWEHVARLVERVGSGEVVVLGQAGPMLPGVLDFRGRTTLAQAAGIIAACRCYVGIDSGLMWMAGSLQVPTVGLYGTEYIARPEAVQPFNPKAVYLNAEGSLDRIAPDAVLEALWQASA